MKNSEQLYRERKARIDAFLNGGSGSGNFGHSGRPGAIGGSGSGGGSSSSGGKSSSSGSPEKAATKTVEDVYSTLTGAGASQEEALAAAEDIGLGMSVLHTYDDTSTHILDAAKFSKGSKIDPKNIEKEIRRVATDIKKRVLELGAEEEDTTQIQSDFVASAMQLLDLDENTLEELSFDYNVNL